MIGRRKLYFGRLAAALFIHTTVLAAPRTPAEFHRAVYALAQDLLAQGNTRTTEERGAYAGSAAARYHFLDTRYYDTASGRLLVHIRRDADRPEAIHIVEVNIYDGAGNLIRDYGSIALPWAPQNPERTFINLHHQNGALHSFRQYDMYGDLSYLACSGRLQGQPIRLDLDGSAIAEQSGSAAFHACFDGFDPDPREFLTPH